MRYLKPINPNQAEKESEQATDIFLRVLTLIILIFVFLVGIKLMGGGFLKNIFI